MDIVDISNVIGFYVIICGFVFDAYLMLLLW